MNELIIHCEDTSLPPAIVWKEVLMLSRKGIAIILGETEGIADSTLKSAFSKLSKEEQERAQKMRREDQRITFIINHALLRLMLSSVTGERPQNILIQQDPQGKPFAPEPFPHFNLSDSGTVFLQGYAPHPLGVDLELIDPDMDYEPIAGRFFTLREIRHIHRSGRPWFFKYWTRKEALLKATGQGIIDSLHCIEVVTGINLMGQRCRSHLPLPDRGYFSIQSFPISSFYVSAASAHKDRIEGICRLTRHEIEEILSE
ncbi:MAG: 4'-phosphopantetheinyl transferase family protein [Bacteroidales bacterium]